ncbi:aminoglycoside phosphotransferase [Sulfurimonas gotlandica GD1]|uniref:Aminoglycoside phosphotransferase n=1 Tax=Sulfurimonas gotlandica (strain DSM 19862 / JCM 16533 / GD1) TaxID=929558 RepID=B6BGC4_SULGG|nr:phosphotransferase [Sulfurimonas gotlandica]EDZ63647.1 aminoglycoside phosphotransferase [Sulfurimonas gotlandica GD1]EHP29551.1 aminoglycoside phosphotransferase [Sulfurimonas gotlandica GD1]
MDKIKAWLKTTPYKEYEISIASADASFRKYYRLTDADKTFLLMDSSLEKDSLAPFIDVTSRLLKVGVNAPEILEKNLKDGFLIIKDFGNTHYLNVLDANNFNVLYSKAIDTIITMQNADTKDLPLYDKAFLHFEMDLMKDWYLDKNLNVTLSEAQKSIIESSLDAISDVVLSQPQDVFVHRDYHSRNIMITPENEIGVIDYQDAMSGAITYDLVSLLKDCYIAYEREEVEKLVLEFRDKKGLDTSDAEFLKWFDFMGMQRHIKVLGIFSRLYLRDGKDGYLKDIPLTLKYTIDAASRYEETKELSYLLKEVQ